MSKERLVELLSDFKFKCILSCKAGYINTSKSCNSCVQEQLADYLLANGVIVPPCKVGSKVYWQNMGGKITEATVIKLLQARVDNGFEYDIPFEEIGKTIFLTREEIEAKLKEGESNA